jgi:hypothetical protein
MLLVNGIAIKSISNVVKIVGITMHVIVHT